TIIGDLMTGTSEAVEILEMAEEPETEINTSEINYKDLKQGRIGDCYFLAALCAKAYQNPESVLEMIESKPDGTFDVKFPEKTINITAPSKSDSRLASGGDWVPIIEKAYAVYANEKLEKPYSDPY